MKDDNEGYEAMEEVRTLSAEAERLGPSEAKGVKGSCKATSAFELENLRLLSCNAVTGVDRSCFEPSDTATRKEAFSSSVFCLWESSRSMVLNAALLSSPRDRSKNRVSVSLVSHNPIQKMAILLSVEA